MLLDDIQTYLIAMGAGTLPVSGLDWPVYEGMLPNDKDRAIGIFETGGYPPDTHERETETVTFQLRVRGSKLDYSTARARWKTCFDLLQDAQAILSPVMLSGVVFIQTTQYGPNHFNDTNGRPNFTSNFRVRRYYA